ncbi:MAG: type ISP restriction/modification enzyme [Ekhidna sp.]
MDLPMLEEATGEIPSFDYDIVHKIAKQLGVTFVPNHATEGNVCFADHTALRYAYRTSITPIDILDYIYAVLHAPTYDRDTYTTIFDVDFPQVPYPKDVETFWKLVALGSELRTIHLTKNTTAEAYTTRYVVVEHAEDPPNNAKQIWELTDHEKQVGSIWIHENGYIDKVPLTAWEFCIDGHYPAQKWLHHLKETEVNGAAILEFQQILEIIYQTDRIMKEIARIDIVKT